MRWYYTNLTKLWWRENKEKVLSVVLAVTAWFVVYGLLYTILINAVRP